MSRWSTLFGFTAVGEFYPRPPGPGLFSVAALRLVLCVIPLVPVGRFLACYNQQLSP